MESVKRFEREDRYIVIKRSDLRTCPVHRQVDFLLALEHLSDDLPTRECVVVESDWPEYEIVWAMIEHRMGGKPVPDFDRVTAEREALQLLLNNRDDLDDQLTSLEQRRYAEQQAREAAERRVEELEGWCRKIMNSSETMLSTVHEEELFALIEPADKGQGEPVPSSVFNDPLYNAESDARNASELLEEVLEWFDDGVGRSPAEFKLMRKIGDWLGRSVPRIDGGSDECDHSEANKIGCPECGEVFK